LHSAMDEYALLGGRPHIVIIVIIIIIIIIINHRWILDAGLLSPLCPDLND